MNEHMKGWKTWTGGGFMLLGALFIILHQPDTAAALISVGATFLGIGIAHKIEKTGKK